MTAFSVPNSLRIKTALRDTLGLDLKYFDCLRGVCSDSKSGISEVHLAWNFAYFADQKSVSKNSVKHKTALFRADSRAANFAEFYLSPNWVDIILKLHIFAIRTQR